MARRHGEYRRMEFMTTMAVWDPGVRGGDGGHEVIQNPVPSYWLTKRVPTNGVHDGDGSSRRCCPTQFSSTSSVMKLLIGTTTAAPEPVLDISGQKLRTGVKYYILPVMRGQGGGLTVASTNNNNNNTCPLFVVQEKFEVLNGKPVTFTPYNAKDGVILTSTDLNIKSYVTTTTCDKPPVWKLLKVLTGVWFLSTGGVEGNPGFDTVINWFKIEKAEKDYVLSFCPSVCKCQTLCRSLGIYIDDDGNKHLALSDKVPDFRVMFKRA